MNACKHVILFICLSLTAGFLAAQTAPDGMTPVTIDVKNEAAVNTEGLDFSPTFYEDGIVFISDQHGRFEKKDR
ncbi:MAG: hypothetical protein IPM81_16295 [Saprospirales bacterium]|nr:hypothetical protein [Saprospirales bacterium]